MIIKNKKIYQKSTSPKIRLSWSPASSPWWVVSRCLVNHRLYWQEMYKCGEGQWTFPLQFRNNRYPSHRCRWGTFCKTVFWLSCLLFWTSFFLIMFYSAFVSIFESILLYISLSWRYGWDFGNLGSQFYIVLHWVLFGFENAAIIWHQDNPKQIQL